MLFNYSLLLFAVKIRSSENLFLFSFRWLDGVTILQFACVLNLAYSSLDLQQQTAVQLHRRMTTVCFIDNGTGRYMWVGSGNADNISCEQNLLKPFLNVHFHLDFSFFTRQLIFWPRTHFINLTIKFGFPPFPIYFKINPFR
jgi:hypothetical protein